MRGAITHMVPVAGNTFRVKDQLKAMGGRWSSDQKCWLVPHDKAEAAKALVGGSGSAPVKRAPRVCKSCGQRINYGVYCGKCEYA